MFCPPRRAKKGISSWTLFFFLPLIILVMIELGKSLEKKAINTTFTSDLSAITQI